jgi:EAL domain-containing protein (putative c-di-GMP-specific phosphodiesterase class I)
MAYQPIVNMSGDCLFGLEALMRWNRKGSPVSPAYFIPVAEETGLIGPLGLYMIEMVCSQVAEWKRLFPGQFVTHLNISGRQLVNPDFATDVEKVIVRTGVDPSALLFEITESVLMDSGGACVQVIKQLRDLGIQFCLDDFGTGFSSLSYLRRLPISSIKIDRSFVLDVESDTQSSIIVRNLQNLGQDLGLDVIVEGIERDSQVNSLLNTGCRLAQGYYFYRPMTRENITELLRKAVVVSDSPQP